MPLNPYCYSFATVDSRGRERAISERAQIQRRDDAESCARSLCAQLKVGWAVRLLRHRRDWNRQYHGSALAERPHRECIARYEHTEVGVIRHAPGRGGVWRAAS